MNDIITEMSYSVIVSYIIISNIKWNPLYLAYVPPAPTEPEEPRTIPQSAPPPSSPVANYQKKVPTSPRIQPDNVCFFRNANILGGDLAASEGGEGVATQDANNCAVKCYQRDKCKYWVFVEGWTNNCFLKSHFDDEEGFPGATSGSIGLSCEWDLFYVIFKKTNCF